MGVIDKQRRESIRGNLVGIFDNPLDQLTPAAGIPQVLAELDVEVIILAQLFELRFAVFQEAEQQPSPDRYEEKVDEQVDPIVDGFTKPED